MKNRIEAMKGRAARDCRDVLEPYDDDGLVKRDGR